LSMRDAAIKGEGPSFIDPPPGAAIHS
jgi:hypothetical protein